MSERQESGRISEQVVVRALAAYAEVPTYGTAAGRRDAMRHALTTVIPSRERVVEVLATHAVECTGLGEVTCGGCRDRSWMSWWDYHQHIADAMLALFSTTSTEGETQS